MSEKMDKRGRSDLFRERLEAAMSISELSRAGLARAVGVDRSTISQLMSGKGARLPNAQVVAECAHALGVSSDWLLGLSNRPELAADLIASAMTITSAPRALVDETIFAWHQEATGYKIRHVPAGLPDMLKTEEMLRWEYEPSLGRTTEQAVGASRDRLQWMRSVRSDFEIAIPRDELRSMALGEGYYSGMTKQMRMRQLEYILQLHRQHYPSLRLYLFNARKVYSAPITVFGPLIAVIYIGQSYLAFRDAERVDALTRHFDGLIREADVSSRDIVDEIARLRDLAS